MKRLLIICLLIIFTALHAFADWKITLTTRSVDGMEFESTFYVKDGILKQESPEMDIIINLNSNTITYVSKATKSYWEGSVENFENELEEMMKKMMIEMMGEDAYNQMEEMEDMEGEGDLNPPEMDMDIEIVDDNESVELAGYTGNKYSVMANGELVEELWLCNEIDAFKDFNFDELDKMFGQEQEEGEGYDYSDSSQYQNLLKSNGLPIREITYNFGEIYETSELVSAEELILPEEMFSAPSDYSKVDLMQLMMGMQGY